MYYITFLSGVFIGMVAMYIRLKKGSDFILKRKDISNREI